MRMRRSWILGATLAVACVACSSAGGGGAASPPTTSRPSRVTTTSPARATSTTEGSKTGASGTACDLVAPADLSAAGIEGTIKEQGDVSKNFNLGSSITSTACSYFVAQGNSSRGVTVVVAEGVDAGALEDAIGLADNPQDVTDVGDRAVYNEEDGMSGATKNEIWAEQSGRLLKVSSVDAAVTPKATLEALARKILAA